MTDSLANELVRRGLHPDALAEHDRQLVELAAQLARGAVVFGSFPREDEYGPDDRGRVTLMLSETAHHPDEVVWESHAGDGA